VQLGGHHPPGEAFVAFQRTLKALTRRGIILGIVSKNTEAIALEAIDRHPSMVLRRDDFAAWRINWKDKAENLCELADELNLGLDAVVFIDDNPAERARVREALRVGAGMAGRQTVIRKGPRRVDVL
jgi:FkbH-like protein